LLALNLLSADFTEEEIHCVLIFGKMVKLNQQLFILTWVHFLPKELAYFLHNSIPCRTLFEQVPSFHELLKRIAIGYVEQCRRPLLINIRKVNNQLSLYFFQLLYWLFENNFTKSTYIILVSDRR